MGAADAGRRETLRVLHNRRVFKIVPGWLSTLGHRQDGSHKEGRWEAAGPFCPQRGSDQRTHQHSKRIHGVGFQKRTPGHSETWDFEGDGNPRCACGRQTQHSLRGQRRKDCTIAQPVLLSRKRHGDEDSPNKLYASVTYVPATTFKNLQTVNVAEN